MSSIEGEHNRDGCISNNVDLIYRLSLDLSGRGSVGRSFYKTVGFSARKTCFTKRLGISDENAPLMTHLEYGWVCVVNLDRSAYDAMILRAEGKPFEKVNTIFPNVNDGLDGIFFIQQCVMSSKENGAWLPLAHQRVRK
jgi:hypothetical protein